MKAALAGYAVAATGPVAPESPYALAANDAHDPRTADSLLDAAGWRRAAGGVRARAGKPLTVELLTVGSGDQAVEQLVQADLAERGMESASWSSSHFWPVPCPRRLVAAHREFRGPTASISSAMYDSRELEARRLHGAPRFSLRPCAHGGDARCNCERLARRAVRTRTRRSRRVDLSFTWPAGNRAPDAGREYGFARRTHIARELDRLDFTRITLKRALDSGTFLERKTTAAPGGPLAPLADSLAADLDDAHEPRSLRAAGALSARRRSA